MTPAAGETIVTAWHEDPVYETRLDHIVAGHGYVPTEHQVIVAGGHLSNALYAVANWFYLRAYWTVMPLDAIYSDTQGSEFGLEFFAKPSFPNIIYTNVDAINASPAPRSGVRGLTPMG